MIHVLKLRDPNIELYIMHPLDEDDDDEEGDDNDGLLGDTHEVLEIPLSIQFYDFIKSMKGKGVSEAEIGVHFGQSKLSRRLILKNLLREKVLSYYVNDRGRQKVRKYVALEYGRTHSRSNLSDDENLESEVELEEETINFTLSDRSEDADDRFQEAETESIVSTTESEPMTTFQSKQAPQILDSDVLVEVIELEKTECCMRSKRQPLDESRITDKMKYRSILMLRMIRASRILDESTKLYSLILRDEKRRGFKDIMCKRTFYRLLTRLCSQKRVRLWQIRFSYENKFRSVMYITDKHIDSNYSMMKSYIEQAKAKFMLSIHNEKNRKLIAQNTALRAEAAALAKTIEEPPRVKISNRRVNYGNTPKFVRLRTLHEFLYYLIYDYKVDPNAVQTIQQDAAIEYWKRNESFVEDYDELIELPPIYTKKIEWKMFMPPMIPHQGFESGWVLLTDCFHRMPLSIFIKTCNINYEIEGLDEFLSHPIKRHFLIHGLPIHIQHALFNRRKYIFGIDDMFKRLCFMGLARIGPKWI